MIPTQAIQAQIRRGKRAVVLGSGFIGMEVASVLASRGVRTTMVFPDDRVWKRLFPPSVSTFFERQFAGHGITFMNKMQEELAKHDPPINPDDLQLPQGKPPPAVRLLPPRRRNYCECELVRPDLRPRNKEIRRPFLARNS